jgi:hypothetical protein
MSGAPSSEMKVPEVCDLENHKCDNGDNQECTQCNHFMACLKHPIAPYEVPCSCTAVRNSSADMAAGTAGGWGSLKT